MTHPYLTLVRTPGVPVRLGAVFVSAVTLGMMSLTVVLCVREWTGSFALAGVASGLFSLGNAAGIALQGRLLDRAGGGAVVGVAGAVCASAILVFVVAGSAGAPSGVLLVSVVVAGGTVPAVTAAVRSWLPSALVSEHDRTASYALLSVAFQAAIAVGPLLVSVCVVVAGPALGGLVAAVLVGVAAGMYVRAARSDHPASLRGRLAGPGDVLTRGLRVVLAVTAMTGVGFGAVVVALPAVMTDRGTPALSGVLFAAIAVGEVCGALAYGSWRWRGRRPLHLVLGLVGSGGAYATAVVAVPSTVVLVVVLFVSGMAAGPVAIVLSALIDDVTRRGVVGRAYALLVSTNLVAIAGGSAAAGFMADLMAPALLLGVPAGLSGIAAGWTLACRQSLLRG
ncbi:MFS transporter [Cellulomonas sp. KRMCY2]|uniref:MFS transporter n=1 Tax=Cellulomonas sp. KRMCY2 TaxID=1304865 RepID=UPI00045EBB6F|nr:MFS transporter [Cellulomonas sp. KRMCY2]